MRAAGHRGNCSRHSFRLRRDVPFCSSAVGIILEPVSGFAERAASDRNLGVGCGTTDRGCCLACASIDGCGQQDHGAEGVARAYLGIRFSLWCVAGGNLCRCPPLTTAMEAGWGRSRDLFLREYPRPKTLLRTYNPR